MKKIVTIIFCVFLSNAVCGQNKLTQTEKLAMTAKVWGYLKYYHPHVADGKFNWDEELFKILPKVTSVTTKEEFSQIFIEWIETLGAIKKCRSCSTEITNSFDKNFNLNWLGNPQFFTKALTEQFRFIEANRHQGNKHYIAYFKGKPRIAFFQNELDYPNFDWSVENMRLLALFRYWNMTEYFFPAKYQIDQDWDSVLIDMIPKFKNLKSRDEYQRALTELVVSLDDSHAFIYPNSEYCNFGCYNVPFEFKIVDSSAIITKYYDRKLAGLDDLRIGDIITKVDGKNLIEIFETGKKYIHGSNEPRKKLNAGYYLLNGSKPLVTLEITRNGKTFSKTIKRYMFKEFDNTSNNQLEKYTLIGDSIGYVNIGLIKTKEVPDVMKAFENTRAIIFDLRFTKTSTPFYFANYITSQKKQFYKSVYPNLDYPGKFLWSEGDSGNDKLKYTGKVILLVDENCQSQMESTAMCLQVGDDVTTIGRQTSGANGNVMRLEMVGGYKTQISGIGFFYPDGTETQRNGVKIDIEVKPSLNEIIEGADEILNRAIEYASN